LGMKTRSLGAHSGSLNKTLVARTRNLGASGDRAPVRQQPCTSLDPPGLEKSAIWSSGPSGFSSWASTFVTFY